MEGGTTQQEFVFDTDMVQKAQCGFEVVLSDTRSRESALHFLRKHACFSASAFSNSISIALRHLRCKLIAAGFDSLPAYSSFDKMCCIQSSSSYVSVGCHLGSLSLKATVSSAPIQKTARSL